MKPYGLWFLLAGFYGATCRWNVVDHPVKFVVAISVFFAILGWAWIRIEERTENEVIKRLFDRMR
jgi:hypothetical protein